MYSSIRACPRSPTGRSFAPELDSLKLRSSRSEVRITASGSPKMKAGINSGLFCLATVLLALAASAGAGSVGVNYGRVANDLPSAFKVVGLIKSQGISNIKLYDSDPAVLRAFSGSGVNVTIALPNEQLFYVARRFSRALSWVKQSVADYAPGTQITAIAVGNEVFANPNNLNSYLVPAMNNIQKALLKFNLPNIKVSSPLALSALQSSYPASNGAFKNELVDSVIRPMLDFLRRTGSPLMVNAYPFFAYKDNVDVIPLDYALFRPNAGVPDPNTGLVYKNLFDAQLDAVFSAMSALGYKDLDIMVSETGWPSKGDEDETGASLDNAAAYNGNLVKHVLSGQGTPLRPKANLDTFLFALFNENKKPGPTSERNYGLFYPSQAKVYDIALTAEAIKNQPPASVIAPGSNPVVSKPHNGGSSGSESWCVASSKADEEQLQAALDYACGEGGADCKQIQPGSACYNPNTLEAHASYAFNSYYQKNSRKAGTCFFGGAAYVVTQPPKYGNCVLPAGY